LYLKTITDSDWVIAISGIKNVKIDSVENVFSELDSLLSDTVYQLFNAEKIAGFNHLYFAAINAVNAHETDVNISNKISVETLLYVSCHDQIFRALQMVGISQETSQIAVIVFSKNQDDSANACEIITNFLGVEDDSVINVTDHKFKLLKSEYDISEIALSVVSGNKFDALSSLIIEKGALLSLKR
jgi:tRNA threonylcarbamoyladenosine modification (KEOPS) complex Cgi121 subunit